MRICMCIYTYICIYIGLQTEELQITILIETQITYGQKFVYFYKTEINY
jgi:hypothetical protein